MKNQSQNTEINETISPEWILEQKHLSLNIARNIIPDFQIDDNNRQIIADVFNYFLELPGNLDLRKGLWLEGDIGTGKSSLMQIFSKFMIARNKGFKIHICSQVVTQYSGTGDIDLFAYNSLGYPKGPVRMCFDELGREPIPGNHFGQKLNVMQHLLHVRYSLWQTEGLKTFVTTNLGADEVEELYGDYIRDRRKEMFNIVVVTGKSRR